MKTNAESLLRQLKKHQKSVEVYEKARLKMLDKEHRSMGLTDIVVQKELKALGVDVKSLLKDTAAEEKQLRGVHKKFLSLVRPPRIPGDLVFEIPPDPNVFEIRPPAFDGIAGSCGGLDRGFNLSLGETNFETHLQGGGWGWQATAGSPCLTTLVFRFTPPRAGNIMVDAFVDFKGQFAISAHDHWYTNTDAKLRLRVSSKLFQHYWEFGPRITLLDQHRTSSSDSGWIDQMEKLSYTTSVSASATVLIFVEIEMSASAQSSHARVDLDFKTGAERRIKVPVIRVTYI